MRFLFSSRRELEAPGSACPKIDFLFQRYIESIKTPTDSD